MSNKTAAQEEFESFLAKNSSDHEDRFHPEDRDDELREASYKDETEEDRYRASQIDAAMRMPTLNHNGAGATAAELKLPPSSFDSGRATGVKGVIADARSYEMARKATWMSRVRQARRSVFGGGSLDAAHHSKSDSEHSFEDKDEETFLQQWRESRRRELESEARGGAAVRTRRTSPSVRIYGRLDEVDALGYLDAIEKVGRETVVVVFVYDHECEVSAAVEDALRPLVGAHPMVHFVKVHYDDIEFDNAAVPAVLAYRNQGDLFANLTGIIEMIPDDEIFDSDALRRLFQSKGVL